MFNPLIPFAILAFYKQIQKRVDELKATTEVGSIAHVISNEFAIPLEEAKDFVCLCALSESLGVSV